MKIQTNAALCNYTTFKMGGIAKQMVIPESEDELIAYIDENKPEYFIGGGSNLLIDESDFDVVVNLREFNQDIVHVENGAYTVGAAVRLQKLITTVNHDGYGGIEYLYSVPGLVGGAIVMNAGRGKQFNKCISDYIISVKVYYDGITEWIPKNECGFSYRNSIFKNSKYLVLAVKFNFEQIDAETTSRLRSERMELCKDVQDNSRPNFGSVFAVSNPLIMKLVRKTPLGKKDGISFSNKTQNWILNCGGSFHDAVSLMERVEMVHRLCHKPCKREVIVWTRDK